MTRHAKQSLALRGEPVEARLARLLDAPDLPRLVPRLPAETLHQLIRHRGLDACEAVVAAATPEQLATILDLDLWNSPQPGMDEQFDEERFGEWLDMLAAMDGPDAARTVAAMDPALVSAGLSRHLRVFDVASLTVWSDGEPMPLAIASQDDVTSEVDGYALFARRTESWEAIVSVLSTLSAERPDLFHEIMQLTREASDADPEVDGLDDLLTAPAQLLHDMEVDREARRAQQGYMTPADSRAFLQMARQPLKSGAPAVNPIAAAYFRGADTSSANPTTSVPPLTLESGGAPDTETPSLDPLDDAVALLAEAGLMPGQPRALLGEREPSSPLARIRELMAYLREHHDAALAARGRELAFLANTLVAGCSLQARSITPREASDAVIATCNLGLESWPVAVEASFLAEHDLVAVFQQGWARLYTQVSAFVANGLLAALTPLRCSDPAVRQGLRDFRRTLKENLEAGTPWQAQRDLDVIAGLDLPAWASLVGLLDECPVIPAAMTALLERRSGSVSAKSFTFISSRSHLEQVRRFMRRLPDLLRH